MAVSPESMFNAALEAVEQLTPEEQEDLTSIVQRRLAERRRKLILQDVADARQEYAEGGCRRTSLDELMGEIMS